MAKRPFKSGEWKVLCDVCGVVYRASEIKRRWDGAMCCPSDWELRQPLDFLRVKPENNQLPFRRPDPVDQFVPINTNLTLPPEYISFDETTYKLYEKYITSDGDSGINDVALNTFAINEDGNSTGPETLTISETVFIAKAIYLDETLSSSETVVNDPTVALSDTETLTESISNTLSTAFSESVSVLEDISNAPQLSYSESITSSETSVFNIQPGINESITLSEDLVNSVTQVLADSQTISETILNDISTSISETLTGSETTLISLGVSRLINGFTLNEITIG